MKKTTTLTQPPVIPEAYKKQDYNSWQKYLYKELDKIKGIKPLRTKVACLLILIGFCLQACSGHICAGKDCNVYRDHDTGTYYRYRAINIHTGRIELAKVDTVWDVYQPTDTVYLDSQGFIAQTRSRIVDTVRLGICVGTVTLVDDTLILSSTHILPKGDYTDIYLDVPPPPIKK